MHILKPVEIAKVDATGKKRFTFLHRYLPSYRVPCSEMQ